MALEAGGKAPQSAPDIDIVAGGEGEATPPADGKKNLFLEG